MNTHARSQGWREGWRIASRDDRSGAVAAVFVRFVLAAFFLAHIYSKFFTRNGFGGWWDALTVRQHHSAIVPIYVLTVEFSCAILLPLGIKTRWVALYAIPSFIGIIAFWLKTGGYWFTNPGAEFPIMWLCLLVLQVILGDGAMSVKVGQSPARA